MKTVIDKLQDSRYFNINETETINYLIAPVLSNAKYDFTDITHVRYELNEGNRTKIDCVFWGDVDGKPKQNFILEAKRLSESLDKQEYYYQLRDYFNSNTSLVKLAILTNGNEYRLFSDFVTPNRMDEKPFVTFELRNEDDLSLLYALLDRDTYSAQTLKVKFIKHELQGYNLPKEAMLRTIRSREALKALFNLDFGNLSPLEASELEDSLSGKDQTLTAQLPLETVPEPVTTNRKRNSNTFVSKQRVHDLLIENKGVFFDKHAIFEGLKKKHPELVDGSYSHMMNSKNCDEKTATREFISTINTTLCRTADDERFESNSDRPKKYRFK
ncbi:hypothetical protein EK599_15080 [Vibrio sp. T187]|uniref:hypothetical protein n=1 Tax=Vibrio TaxID=662 RepID=UPI0010C947DD|nr:MULTISPECIES: hypothetical protein [Vibrio]MBW3697023.1 hypothetical protein [Vibrio sp. T187]